MESIVQSDIFFFITAVAVIVVMIFVLVALWYVIKILKNIKDVSEIMKSQALFLSGDFSGIRRKMREFFDALVKKVSGKRRSSK